MKTILLSLLFTVAANMVYADSPASNPSSANESSSAAAAYEAQVPVTSLPLHYLENADGTITLGYIGDFGPHIVYVLNGISINPNDIPNLNVEVNGSNFNPGSVPYTLWSGWNIKPIDPPKVYYWDEQAGGFRAGYTDPTHPFFFKRGDELYQKSDLPAGAAIIDSKGLKIIPIKIKPTEIAKQNEANQVPDEQSNETLPNHVEQAQSNQVKIRNNTQTAPISWYYFVAIAVIVIGVILGVVLLYRKLSKDSS